MLVCQRIILLRNQNAVWPKMDAVWRADPTGIPWVCCQSPSYAHSKTSSRINIFLNKSRGNCSENMWVLPGTRPPTRLTTPEVIHPWKTGAVIPRWLRGAKPAEKHLQKWAEKLNK